MKKAGFFEGYTDGYTLVAGWEWGASEVSNGEQVGLCVEETDGSGYATCWVYNMADDVYQMHNNYIFPSDLIKGDLNMEDLIGISDDYQANFSLFPGMFGSW